jgi:hypothetical protein
MASAAQHVAQAIVRGDTRHARAEFNSLAQTTGRVDAATAKASASFRGMNSAVMGAVGGFMAATAGIVALAAAVDRSMDRAVELSNVYSKLAFSVDEAAEAVGNQTTKFNLAKQANRLHTAGLADTADEYAKITGVVAKLADAQGKELDPSIEAVTKSLVQGSERGIKQLGIYTDMQAEQKRLGHTMSLVEKRQYLLNVVMEEGARTAELHGTAIETKAHKWVAFKNAITNYTDAAIDAAFGSGTVATESEKLSFQIFELMGRVHPLTAGMFALADAADEVSLATEQMTLKMAMADIESRRLAKRTQAMNNEIAQGFEASRQAIEDFTATEAKALKRDIDLMEAAGAKTEEVSRLKSQLAGVEAAREEARGESGKAEEIRHKEEVRRIKAVTDAEGKRGGRGRGGGGDAEKKRKEAERAAEKAEKDRIAGEVQGLQNLIEARNQESEVFSRTSEDKMAIIEDELERQQLVLEFRRQQLELENPETEAERLALLQEGREIDHEERMALIEAEAERKEELRDREDKANELAAKRREKAHKAELKANKERAQSQRDMASAVISVSSTIVDVMEAAANASGEISKQEAIAIAVGKGLVTIAIGAAAIAEGAINVASQNYVKGIPQIATGAAGVVVGSLLMAGQIREAAGKSGRGGGGGGAATGGGIGSAAGGGGQQGQSGFGGGGDAPVSPLDPSVLGTGGRQPQGGQSGGSKSVSVTVQGDVVGGSADEIATKLNYLIQDGERRSGRVAGG